MLDKVQVATCAAIYVDEHEEEAEKDTTEWRGKKWRRLGEPSRKVTLDDFDFARELKRSCEWNVGKRRLTHVIEHRAPDALHLRVELLACQLLKCANYRFLGVKREPHGGQLRRLRRKMEART
uniref:Uncharacterized protein n=1 Tax=Vespula pensylvanica TaxID=30213 RepID=A0A834JL41_VESPE|nr:hypothetical protein H0235_017710 [Vespula pensylvanica]